MLIIFRIAEQRNGKAKVTEIGDYCGRGDFVINNIDINGSSFVFVINTFIFVLVF